jgi:hypothetical protein
MTGAMGCAAPGGVGLFSPAHRERSFLQRAGPEVRAAGFSEPVDERSGRPRSPRYQTCCVGRSAERGSTSLLGTRPRASLFRIGSALG